MSAARIGSQCPFCQAAVPRKVSVCPGCHAQKQSRSSMSPAGFKAFALIWLSCTVVLAASALYLALLPWLPDREAPPYALRLVGATAVQATRCTVEVIPGPNATAAASEAVPCAPRDAVALGSTDAQALGSPTRRRLAAALHGAVVLSLAAVLSGLLWLVLRPLFLRSTGQGWVRRSVA